MKKGIIKWIKNLLFYPKWRCISCNKEIFSGEYFCLDCKEKLPFNKDKICDHCGRKLKVASTFCSTCKGVIVSVDKSRSVFNYSKPISTLIQKAKYGGGKYLLDMFSEYLEKEYYKNYFNADFLAYIPMTDKAKKKRGYNQSEVLARKLGERVNVSVTDCLIKVLDTVRQAKLNRQERLKNLTNAYKVINKKEVKDKVILIIDDVTTTGSTAEAVAKKLKDAGARLVYLLTVASVPPKENW